MKQVEKRAQREIDKFPLFSIERRLSMEELNEVKREAKAARSNKYVASKASEGCDCTSSVHPASRYQKELEDFTNLMKQYHHGNKDFLKHRARAKKGNAEAQYELGCCYHYGTFVKEEDQNQAIYWWTKAAKQDHVEAQLKLAWMYQNHSWHFPQDGQREHNNHDCNNENIGHSNSKLHWMWLQRAAKLGDLKAQRTVALYYFNRPEREREQRQKQQQQQQQEKQYMDENQSRAKEIREEKKSNGSFLPSIGESSAIDIDEFLEEDDDDNEELHFHIMPGVVEENLELHAEWLERAALQGDAEAQYQLGLCFYCGPNDPYDNLHNTTCPEGILNNDPVVAAQWLTRAAEQGHAKALDRMAWFYYRGHGVTKQDVRIAAKCWESAADKRMATAQFQIGTCYFYGRGVSFWERSYQLAVHYYWDVYQRYVYRRRRQEQCSPSIDRILNLIRDRILEIEERASDEKQPADADAQAAMAFCYENGLVVERDLDLANKWSDEVNETIRSLKEMAHDQEKENGFIFASSSRRMAHAQVRLATFMAQEILLKRKQQLLISPLKPKFSYDSLDSSKDISNDFIKVIMWLQRAAEQPQRSAACTIAQYRLGDCYCRGIGVSVNYPLALQYFKKAVMVDVVDKKEYATIVGRDDVDGQRQRARTRTLALYSLGQCFFLGRGMTRNRSSAVEYFYLAYKALRHYPHPTTENSLAKTIERRIRSIQEEIQNETMNDSVHLNDAQRAISFCRERGFIVTETSESIDEKKMEKTCEDFYFSEPTNSTTSNAPCFDFLFSTLAAFGLLPACKQDIVDISLPGTADLR